MNKHARTKTSRTILFGNDRLMFDRIQRSWANSEIMKFDIYITTVPVELERPLHICLIVSKQLHVTELD